MDIGMGELEKKVKEVLEKNPSATVELSDLSETTYERLKIIFEVDYVVNGIINILKIGNRGIDEAANYALHIRRK